MRTENTAVVLKVKQAQQRDRHKQQLQTLDWILKCPEQMRLMKWIK